MPRLNNRRSRFRTRAIGSLVVAVAACVVALPVDSQTPSEEESFGSGNEVLLQAAFDRASGDPLELRLVRIALEPGGTSPRHTHPGLEFGVVEEGSLVVRVTGVALRRSRDLPDDAESEILPEGVEAMLGAGDRIAYAPETEMMFRNPGPGRTVVLAATVLPTGEDAPPGAVFPGGVPQAADVAGVESRILGVAVVDDLPEGRLAIALERLVAGSGDAIAGFPGPVLITVESGGLSGSVLDGAVELPAAAAATSDGAGTSGDGTAFDLAPGEALYFPAGMAATPPLGGEGTVALLRLGIVRLPEDVSPPAVPTEPSFEPTATPNSEADPTAESVGLSPGTTVVVVEDDTRLRAGPSLDDPVVNGFDQGRRLVVTGEPVEGLEYLWYPVEDPADPTIVGYVAGELLAPES